ncbi:MAG: hypothetical protein HYS12_25920 [Planctomycetes bacterium]|nr:hypothetical protein [Planctomycetota bacterium]
MALLVLAAAPSSARASCGDYVVGGTAAPHVALSPSTSSRHTDTPMSPPAPRCHGPSCTPGDFPLPAPTPPPPTRNEQWGDLCLSVLPGDGGSCPYTLPASRFVPPDRADDIFHPPRSDRNLTR